MRSLNSAIVIELMDLVSNVDKSYNRHKIPSTLVKLIFFIFVVKLFHPLLKVDAYHFHKTDRVYHNRHFGPLLFIIFKNGINWCKIMLL